MASVEDLERRVSVIEGKLDDLTGGQEVILGVLRDQGRILAAHETRFDQIDGKLDIIVGWIETQP